MQHTRPYLRLPEWLITMRWEGVNPRTAVLRAVRLVCLGVSGSDEGGAVQTIAEDVTPQPGLTVFIGDSLVVHLGGDSWEVRTVPARRGPRG